MQPRTHGYSTKWFCISKEKLPKVVCIRFRRLWKCHFQRSRDSIFSTFCYLHVGGGWGGAVFGGEKCCKTAWLQGSISPVPEDQLVWFSVTSARLTSCWKTPQNAGNSLSELQEIQNFQGCMPQTPLEACTFGGRLSCLRILVMAWSAALFRILIS
jgi:hypothetical protein